MSHPASLGLRGVSVGYPQGPDVLRELSLSITSGTRTALLGANGSGKTTLLRTLAGSVQPRQGCVFVDEEQLKRGRRQLNRHRQLVQLVLQDPDDQLFSVGVYDDVSFGPTNLGLDPDEVRQRVNETLEVLGISDLADRPVHALSYGQRKRVAIAGAVAMRPRFLLLDEPTAGLDSVGTESLLACLSDLEARGTCVTLATHDLALAWEWADQVALLAAGRLQVDAAHRVLCDDRRLVNAELRRPWQAVILDRLGLDLGGASLPRTATEVADALGAHCAADPQADR